MIVLRYMYTAYSTGDIAESGNVIQNGRHIVEIKRLASSKFRLISQEYLARPSFPLITECPWFYSVRENHIDSIQDGRLSSYQNSVYIASV